MVLIPANMWDRFVGVFSVGHVLYYESTLHSEGQSFGPSAWRELTFSVKLFHARLGTFNMTEVKSLLPLMVLNSGVHQLSFEVNPRSLGFDTSQVVRDAFHQHYFLGCSIVGYTVILILVI